jgi:hypothetical protein
MRQLIIAVTLVFIVSACASAPKMATGPDWIKNPGSNYVGKCGTHIRGLIAQEQCAYKNGLTYIAMSKGVSVDVAARISMQQSSRNATGKSYGEVNSTLEMDEKNIQINAEIIEKWHDRTRDIMYVLIKEN